MLIAGDDFIKVLAGVDLLPPGAGLHLDGQPAVLVHSILLNLLLKLCFPNNLAQLTLLFSELEV